MLRDLTIVDAFTLLYPTAVTCQGYMALCPLLKNYFANSSWVMGEGSREDNLRQRAAMTVEAAGFAVESFEMATT